MKHPRRVILSAYGKNLGKTIDVLRDAIAKLAVHLRHLIPSMIGGIEIQPRFRRKTLMFNVHTHAFFDDVREDLPARIRRDGLDAKWRAWTRSGSIKVEHQSIVVRSQIREAVGYAVKWFTWCPRVPCESPELLRRWREDRDNRKRVLGWGYRPKRENDTSGGGGLDAGKRRRRRPAGRVGGRKGSFGGERGGAGTRVTMVIRPADR